MKKEAEDEEEIKVIDNHLYCIDNCDIPVVFHYSDFKCK